MLYSQQMDTGTVFHSDTRLVVCPTTVMDRAGHLVDHLTKDAFSVFENNVRQEIKVFRHEDVPVSIGLVIDSSSHHVTHVLLQEGHLWGRKDVAIPIGAVTGIDDGIQLRLSKQEVQDLPAVDIKG